jgi:hypothetical protein
MHDESTIVRCKCGGAIAVALQNAESYNSRNRRRVPSASTEQAGRSSPPGRLRGVWVAGAGVCHASRYRSHSVVARGRSRRAGTAPAEFGWQPMDVLGGVNSTRGSVTARLRRCGLVTEEKPLSSVASDNRLHSLRAAVKQAEASGSAGAADHSWWVTALCRDSQQPYDSGTVKCAW